MNEQEAILIADALGGEAWQSGGDMWLVLIRRPEGGLIAISKEAISEYQSESDFDACRPRSMIPLETRVACRN